VSEPIRGAEPTVYAEAEPEILPPEPGPPEPVRRTRALTVIQTLIEEPGRFSFDAAISVLMQAAGRAEPGDAVRFHAVSGLGFVPADVLEVERDDLAFRATVGLIGLTGPSGVLPRPYTETVNTEQRRRSGALANFLDLLAQRPIAHFAEAAIKYRPHRTAEAAAIAARGGGPMPSDGMREILLALTGYGTPQLAPRLAVGTDPLLYYAGFFAAHPRSADRLEALLSDWLGQRVEIEQFAGAWLSLGPDQMSALPAGDRPGNFNRLGVDAAIGDRSWDVQSRIVLHIGPLDLDRFEALLPAGELLARLASLVRAYLGFETGFAVNPILAAASVPPLEMSDTQAPRLGWNSWLPTSGPRRLDAAEAVFEAELIESVNAAA